MCPGSDEHKELRWRDYLIKKREEGKPPKSYDIWEAAYYRLMTLASKANEVVDAYHKEIGGWGRREVTVYPGGYARRLDIGDVEGKRAIEHKTGRCDLSKDIEWEMDRDEILKDEGWDITWHFEGEATQRVRDALEIRGIKMTFK